MPGAVRSTNLILSSSEKGKGLGGTHTLRQGSWHCDREGDAMRRQSFARGLSRRQLGQRMQRVATNV